MPNDLAGLAALSESCQIQRMILDTIFWSVDAVGAALLIAVCGWRMHGE